MTRVSWMQGYTNVDINLPNPCVFFGVMISLALHFNSTKHMARIRQKIQLEKYDVLILNFEVQGKLVVKVLDKKGKSLGEISISGDGRWYENGKIILPISLN
jgi:hypothetical protein